MARATTDGSPIRDVIAEHAATLAAAGVGSPEADVRWLVEHVVGAPALRSGEPLVASDVDRIATLVSRRAQREPLQHLVGTAAFRTIEVRVRPGVFVPRPETEVLVGHAVAALSGNGHRPLRVLEPCTGTGVIALSVATEVPGVEVIATDVSAAAVDLARDNITELATGFATGSRVRSLQGHLFEPVDPGWRGSVDLLVSNPPYLAARDLDACEPEVRLHDPHEALVGGDEGHEIVDALIAAAPAWLYPGGSLLLEIDEGRAAAAADLARRAGLGSVQVHADLAGRPRVLAARMPA